MEEGEVNFPRPPLMDFGDPKLWRNVNGDPKDAAKKESCKINAYRQAAAARKEPPGNLRQIYGQSMSEMDFSC